MTPHDEGELGLIWPPRQEAEVCRANARRYVAATNQLISKSCTYPADKDFYVVLEVARNAYDAHGITSEKSASGTTWLAVMLGRHRFVWEYDGGDAAGDYVKIRDNLTGNVVLDPMWYRG